MNRLLPLASALAVIALAGCPKQGSGRGNLVLRALWSTPTVCGQWTRYEGEGGLAIGEPTGCQVSARYTLTPTGERELTLPPSRDAGEGAVEYWVEASGVREVAVHHADPRGERTWDVVVPGDALSDPDAGCVAADTARAAIDLRPWRTLIVRVLSRDGYGALRPITESQDDTLALTLAPVGNEAFQPRLVRSETHEGVWAAVWCSARTPGEAELTLDVRGAYQLEVDRFTLPPHDGELNTVLTYVVLPTDRE